MAVGSPTRKSVNVAESHGPESVIAGDVVVVLKVRLKKFRAAVTELDPLAVPMNCSSGSFVPVVVMLLPSVTVMNERLTFPAMSCESVAFSREPARLTLEPVVTRMMFSSLSTFVEES